MGKSLSAWTLCELCRIAERDPQRGDRILEALWTSHPRLLTELAISAVGHNEIPAHIAAEAIGVSPEEIQSRVETFKSKDRPKAPIVEDDGLGIARLAEGHVPVWEVVREHDKTKSIEDLAKAFPALTTAELEAAIAYGKEHRAEIAKLISQYETMQDRKRSEYPFAK